ncbi:MAG TPA: 50S ribosomal protein L1 [Candidatus Nanoarchaeia archaeon]|nr:50S ribosomal protein L1 [Candidatus Nanoarchaeia archaeon]
MDKKQFTQAITALKTFPSKKFKQSYEFIINLRDLDLKKPEEQVELWIALPHDKGRATKVAALIGPEMAETAKATCDLVITHDQFAKFAADKKAVKKLACDYDYFIAQANIMPDVAKTFGRVFGPRGKMPNPKAGCVVPPNTNLKVLIDRLRKTVKVVAKTQPSIKVLVGKEGMAEDSIAENMNTVYTNVLHKLPSEFSNIRSILLKMTMTPPVRITEDGVVKPEVKTKDTQETKVEEKTSEPAKPKRTKKAKKSKEGEST